MPEIRRLHVSAEHGLRRMFSSDAPQYNTIEQRVTAKAVVTMDAFRKLARRVETSMALPFVPMTLEFKSTSRPLMQ